MQLSENQKIVSRDNSKSHLLHNLALKKHIQSPFLLSGIVLSILVWFIDPLIGSLVFKTGPFYETLLNPDKHETYMRLSMSLIVLIYSFIGGYFLNRSRQRESILKLFIEHSPASIAMFDNKMCYLAFSNRFLSDFDLEEQDLTGRSHYDVFPEIPDRWKEIHQRCLTGLCEKSDEDSFLRADGTLEWVRWEIYPWYENNNRIGGIILFSEVITERKRLRTEIQLREKRYRSLIEATSSIVWTTDGDGKFIEPQESWEKFTGQTWDEYKDYGWIAKIHPDDKERILEAWRDACEKKLFHKNQGRIWNNELEQWRDFEVRAIPVLNQDGSLHEWIGIIVDNTENIQAVEKLKESESRLREAQDMAHIGYWFWYVNTGECIWSDEVYRIFRLNPDEFTPEINSIMELSPWPEDNARHQEIVQKTIENRTPGTFEQRFLRPDGSIGIYFSTFQGVYNELDELIAMKGTIQDITERKQAEKSITRFGRIFEESLNEIYLFDADSLYFKEMNKAAQQNLGYTMEEFKSMTPLDIKPEITPELFSELIKPLLEGEKDSIVFETVHERKDKSIYDVEVHLQLLKYEREVLFNAIVLDISERKQAHKQLHYQASHDSLTGLINRHEFEKRVERLILFAQTNKTEHAMCFMDLDQFKIVNDTFGHVAGDEMLRQLTSVLQTTIRQRDTLARLGGDEFAILIERCSLEDAHRVALSILEAVQNYQFLWKGQTMKSGISIGLVSINETTSNITELLKEADTACYMAKEAGRNRIHIYHSDDLEIAQRQGEMEWVAEIHQALDENRFCLYSQFILSLDNEAEKHYELLVRMIDKKGKLVLPGVFLPAAERYNLVSQIDAWVIRNAFHLFSEHREFFDNVNFCSINLSGQSLASPDFLEFVITQVNKFNIKGNQLCFEITETAAISNLVTANIFISTLKKLGCRFALDDFGRGLSSFAYLKNLPVDYLKIDGMFVKDIVHDPIDHAMVKSINEIGHVMKMQTIAEFVESGEIKGMLREIGVNFAQGYDIGKPEEFEKLLTNR